MKKTLNINKLYFAIFTLVQSFFIYGAHSDVLKNDIDSKSNISPNATDVIKNDTVKQILIGVSHSCLITQKEDLYCYGMNDNGQIGDGTNISKFEPTKILSNIKSVSLGMKYTCAINNLNELYCWGKNDNGEVGNGTNLNVNSPTRILTDVSHVETSLGEIAHTCAIKTNGDLYCFGSANYGQLGNGNTSESVNSPTKILSSISQVSLGARHTCAIKNTGKLYCFGNNDKGQIGNGKGGKGQKEITPRFISDNVSLVKLGKDFTCTLDNFKKVYCFGDNEYGQVGSGSKNDYVSTQKLVLDNAISLNVGLNYACAVKRDDDNNRNLYCWGQYDFEQDSNSNAVNYKATPTLVSLLTTSPIGCEQIGNNVLMNKEICDGLDNDCDGEIDEDYEIGKMCLIDDMQGSFKCFNENSSHCTINNDSTNNDDKVETEVGTLGEGCEQIPFSTFTPTNTLTVSKTPTVTKTPTNTYTFTDTKVVTNTPTNIQTETVTNIPTDTVTNTPTNIPTDTATNIPTDTVTNTPTNVPTDTVTKTPTNTYTFTDTKVVTNTPTNIPTDTATNIPTDTVTNTPTNVPTDTATNIPTDTKINTPSNTPINTSTKTPLPTDTPIKLPTDTPVKLPTDTPLIIPTATPVLMDSPTNTLVPTNAVTDTPVRINTPSNTPYVVPTIDVVIPNAELPKPQVVKDKDNDVLEVKLPKINYGSINGNTNDKTAKIKYQIHVRKLKRLGVKDNFYKLGKKILSYHKNNKYKFKNMDNGIYSVRYQVIITKGDKTKVTKWSKRVLVAI